jgi:LPXTG-motif cell wall-anchored protein
MRPFVLRTGTKPRVTVRTLYVAVAIPLALLMTAWGTRTSDAQAMPATQQSRCESPGKVYSQKVIVGHKDKRFDLKTLFLVCSPSHVVAIVDSDGRSYKDLRDFRAHNHLFSEDDKITLPRNFPSVDTSANAGLMTVSGHTGTSSVWWWLIGGVVLVLVSAGGLSWLRTRRRASTSEAGEEEPSPQTEPPT